MESVTTPKPVQIFHDAPFWESVNDRQMKFQRCVECKEWRYPSGPICPNCTSSAAEWHPVKGNGEILSWVVFHRTYLPAYPAPHKVIAVRLDEGPIMISTLTGREPEGSWIGKRVQLGYTEMPDGVVLPTFSLP